jgi:hypothetical protein
MRLAGNQRNRMGEDEDKGEKGQKQQGRGGQQADTTRLPWALFQPQQGGNGQRRANGE